MVCIYFGIFAILNLIFCLSWGTKLSKRNRNGAVLGSYKATCKMMRRQEPVFLYRNLSLLLILFENFKPIDSPERVSLYEQEDLSLYDIS